MTEKKRIKVKVSDKRVRPADDTGGAAADDRDPGEETKVEAPEGETVAPAGSPAPEGAGDETNRDYLEDLLRVQAEFENTRKRLQREKDEAATRATGAFVSRLLPVLDNLGRAVAHGEVDPGVQLVHKELIEILASEGLEEIEALGRPFDPTVHDAVDAREDGSVDEPTCLEVYRPGYRFKGSTIRPSMVVVARPPEPEPPEPEPIEFPVDDGTTEDVDHARGTDEG